MSSGKKHAKDHDDDGNDHEGKNDHDNGISDDDLPSRCMSSSEKHAKVRTVFFSPPSHWVGQKCLPPLTRVIVDKEIGDDDENLCVLSETQQVHSVLIQSWQY